MSNPNESVDLASDLADQWHPAVRVTVEFLDGPMAGLSHDIEPGIEALKSVEYRYGYNAQEERGPIIACMKALNAAVIQENLDRQELMRRQKAAMTEHSWPDHQVTRLMRRTALSITASEEACFRAVSSFYVNERQ